MFTVQYTKRDRDAEAAAARSRAYLAAVNAHILAGRPLGGPQMESFNAVLPALPITGLDGRRPAGGVAPGPLAA